MKYIVAAALVATTVAGFGASANAAGGCGPGWYRSAYGACRPMRGPVVVAPRPPVVVVRPGRTCPPGFFWRYGRCRAI